MSSTSVDSNADDPSVVTPFISSTLEDIGKYILHYQSAIVGQLILYGVYLVLVLMALNAIRRTPMKTRRSWGLLFALLLTFFITTFNWILRFVKLQKMIEMTLLGLGTDGNMSLSGRRSSFGVWLRSSSSLYYPSIWFFNEIADAGIPVCH